MKHNIVTVKDVYAIGMKMSVNFQTMHIEMAKLARAFMPRRHEIINRIGTHAFSIQDYKQQHFKTITPESLFDKWVAVEVTDLNTVPKGMESLTLKGGDYLVIDYKGTVADFPKIWQFVLKEWLPNSEYVIDDRPHFEKLPETYNPQNQINEETVWIPVKKVS